MQSDSKPPVIFTVGHSTKTAEEFISLLQAHAVTLLLDIRTVPRSRTNPQFNKDALPQTLAQAGIRYQHVPELGGLRKPNKDSINLGWRNLSFRGYADYMQTPQFSHAIDHLLSLAEDHQVALMCAEAVPWRCHRSLVSDALTVRGIPVEELSSIKKRQPHKLTRFAAVSGSKLTYPSDDSGVISRSGTDADDKTN